MVSRKVFSVFLPSQNLKNEVFFPFRPLFPIPGVLLPHVFLGVVSVKDIFPAGEVSPFAVMTKTSG